MLVTTEDNGREVPNLRVGAANVRKYFPKSMSAVELLLGDLRIQCKLTPEFWNGKPEISDPRLGAWLKFKVCRQRAERNLVTFAMKQTGHDAFALRPVPDSAKRAARLAVNVQKSRRRKSAMCLTLS